MPGSELPDRRLLQIPVSVALAVASARLLLAAADEKGNSGRLFCEVAMSDRQDPGRVECVDVERGIPLFNWLERIPASRRETLLWYPPDDLKEQYPDRRQLVVPFRCYLGADGLRRFSPVGGTRPWHGRERPDPLVFIRWAWAGGLPLLGRLRHLTDDDMDMFRMKYFVFLDSLELKEFYRREFLYKQDLAIPWREREDKRLESMLDWIEVPECCRENLCAEANKTRGGKAKIPETTVNIDSFIELGRSRAVEDGIPTPHISICLKYGFYAAAQHAPRAIPEDEVPRLIQQSLFDFPVPPTRERVEQAWARTYKAYVAHRRHSTEGFNDWRRGPKGNFFSEVSKLRRAPGGKFDIHEFRRAVLVIGWDAFTSVAACLEQLMVAFAAALPQPLNSHERQLFEQMHLPQPHLGGFPLILLAERFQFCGLAIREVVEHPGDRRSIEVFHRQLKDYAILVSQRKPLDRSVKSEPQTRQFEDNEDPSSDGRTDRVSR